MNSHDCIFANLRSHGSPICRRVAFESPGVLISRLTLGAMILATFFEVVWDPLDALCATRFWLSLFFGAAIRGTAENRNA